MKNLTVKIHNILDNNPAIQHCLCMNLINMRALARSIKNTENINASMDAIISVLRRYKPYCSIKENEHKKLFSDFSILIKHGVAVISLYDNAFEQVAKDFLRDQVLRSNIRLIKTKEYFKIIISEKNFDEKIAVFKKDDIKDIKRNITEFRLIFSSDITPNKGIFAKITSQLSMHDVNIVDVFACTPEILVYVEEINALKAHEALLDLKKA